MVVNFLTFIESGQKSLTKISVISVNPHSYSTVLSSCDSWRELQLGISSLLWQIHPNIVKENEIRFSLRLYCPILLETINCRPINYCQVYSGSLYSKNRTFLEPLEKLITLVSTSSFSRFPSCSLNNCTSRDLRSVTVHHYFSTPLPSLTLLPTSVRQWGHKKRSSFSLPSPPSFSSPSSSFLLPPPPSPSFLLPLTSSLFPLPYPFPSRPSFLLLWIIQFENP